MRPVHFLLVFSSLQAHSFACPLVCSLVRSIRLENERIWLLRRLPSITYSLFIDLIDVIVDIIDKLRLGKRRSVGKKDGLMKTVAPQIIYSFHCAIIGIKWRWKDLNFITKNCEGHVCYGLIMGKE